MYDINLTEIWHGLLPSHMVAVGLQDTLSIFYYSSGTAKAMLVDLVDGH